MRDPLLYGLPFVDTFFSGFNQNSVAKLGPATPDDPVRITTPTGAFVTGPQLSPDGTKVAYIQDNGLWVVSWPDGGDETEIIAGTVHDFVDSCWWAPDGSVIAYACENTDSIFTVEPDGSNDQAIYTDGSARPCGGPSYNRDGTLIAFTVLLSATTFGIFVANADGTGAAQVGTASPTQFSQLYFDVPPYSWANLSDFLCYGGGTLAAPTVRKVNADGTGDTLLGSAAVGAGRPLSRRITSDDDYVLMFDNATQDVRRFATDGSGSSVLLTGAIPWTNTMFAIGGTVWLCSNASPNRIYTMFEDGTGLTQLTSGTDEVSLL